ncbi:AAA family ATPase [Pelagerythrobacter aerophilus]|uniref:AAA family ATPase n=1 Tax=Pelagerythrobacter aerophilus TaxID=2306995 RepID=UPI0016026850|nr:AAA family ATPase [Pelagerythrobacter aerophilus]
MSVPENYDANDVEVTFGLDKVREAFAQRRSTLPPVPDYPDEGEQERPRITATPFVWRAEHEIPRREWLYGRHLIRKFLSLDIAPGGLGKSSLKVVEALSLTSGHQLLGKAIHGGPYRVWVYNLEDPAEETERRFVAAAKHYNLGPEHFGDRLYADTGREQALCIAEETHDGARIIKPVTEALIEEIKARQIDVMVIDPFVSSHTVSENDNRAIDMVAKEWSRIADVCNCSINLVHHVRKTNGAEVTAESSRGAVSLIGAARSVVVYNRMTKEEGERAGIEPDKRGFYFRTQNDKANLAPPEAADWHRMNNVDLDNGDSVGVACPWQWPDSFEGVTGWHLKQVQARVADGQFRRDTQAKAWVGNVIADVCNLDPKKDRHRVNDILKQWIANEMLIEVEGFDANRKTRTFVEVGTWHTE